MKKILSIILSVTLVFSITLSLAGCGTKKVNVSTEKNNNDEIVQKLNKKIEQLNENNQKLSEEVKKLKQENEYLDNDYNYYANEENAKQQKLYDMVAIIDMLRNNQISNYDIMPIYSADAQGEKTLISCYISVPKDKSVKQKLDIIADNVSKMNFGSLPVKVVEIKNISGKKTAIVNLEESKENKNIEDALKLKKPNWRTIYFQGSTGGSMTQSELIKCFLQRKYKGDWIDAVKFTYENEPVDFQHVPELYETVYR